MVSNALVGPSLCMLCGWWFQYDLKFCRVYKRFRDLLDVYDAIAEAHGTGEMMRLLQIEIVASLNSLLFQLICLLKCQGMLCPLHRVWLARLASKWSSAAGFVVCSV